MVGPARHDAAARRHTSGRASGRGDAAAPERPSATGRARIAATGRAADRPDGRDRPRDGRPRRRGPIVATTAAPRSGVFASAEDPRRRDKEPDPDSPFAKLAALKAQLEANAKDGH